MIWFYAYTLVANDKPSVPFVGADPNTGLVHVDVDEAFWCGYVALHPVEVAEVRADFELLVSGAGRTDTEEVAAEEIDG